MQLPWKFKARDTYEEFMDYFVFPDLYFTSDEHFFPFEMHCNSMGQYQMAFSNIKKAPATFSREKVCGTTT